MSSMVGLKDFGKDHWSTLLYIETRAVDHGGLINRQNMRGHRAGDKDRYPTRLRGGVELRGHDDFDCLRDLQSEGLVTRSQRDGLVTFGLTDLGWEVAGRLRRWKANGEPGIGEFVFEESD